MRAITHAIHMFELIWVASAVVAFAGLTLLFAAAFLGVRALLSNGHPRGDHLRQLAGEAPQMALNVVAWASTLVFVGVIAAFVIVTFAHA